MPLPTAAAPDGAHLAAHPTAQHHHHAPSLPPSSSPSSGCPAAPPSQQQPPPCPASPSAAAGNLAGCGSAAVSDDGPCSWDVQALVDHMCATRLARPGRSKRPAAALAEKAKLMQPSGPRAANEGIEDEEQGVLSVAKTASGGVELHSTLLAAGFVIGPAGSSVRAISKQSGADIRSFTQRPSGTSSRFTRRFTIEGSRKSVAEALQLVADAIDRYKELSEGNFCGQAVTKIQHVRGVEFVYQPPPKSKVPYAAAIDAPGSSPHTSPQVPPPASRPVAFLAVKPSARNASTGGGQHWGGGKKVAASSLDVAPGGSPSRLAQTYRECLTYPSPRACPTAATGLTANYDSDDHASHSQPDHDQQQLMQRQQQQQHCPINGAGGGIGNIAAVQQQLMQEATVTATEDQFCGWDVMQELRAKLSALSPTPMGAQPPAPHHSNDSAAAAFGGGGGAGGGGSFGGDGGGGNSYLDSWISGAPLDGTALDPHLWGATGGGPDAINAIGGIGNGAHGIGSSAHGPCLAPPGFSYGTGHGTGARRPPPPPPPSSTRMPLQPYQHQHQQQQPQLQQGYGHGFGAKQLGRSAAPMQQRIAPPPGFTNYFATPLGAAPAGSGAGLRARAPTPPLLPPRQPYQQHLLHRHTSMSSADGSCPSADNSVLGIGGWDGGSGIAPGGSRAMSPFAAPNRVLGGGGSGGGGSDGQLPSGGAAYGSPFSTPPTPLEKALSSVLGMACPGGGAAPTPPMYATPDYTMFGQPAHWQQHQEPHQQQHHHYPQQQQHHHQMMMLPPRYPSPAPCYPSPAPPLLRFQPSGHQGTIGRTGGIGSSTSGGSSGLTGIDTGGGQYLGHALSLPEALQQQQQQQQERFGMDMRGRTGAVHAPQRSASDGQEAFDSLGALGGDQDTEQFYQALQLAKSLQGSGNC